MSFELICFLNFGYPTIEASLLDVEKYYDCGCRTIQLDVPSRDPYLEQQYVKDRMSHCLKTNPDLSSYFGGIEEVHRRHPDIKIHLSLYGDTVERIGVEKVIDFCKRNGIEDLGIISDSPVIRQAKEKAGMVSTAYVGCDVSDCEVERARAADKVSVQVRPLPGQKVNDRFASFADRVRYLRSQGARGKIYASVGIKTPEDIRAIKAAGADGAYIGSVLMQAIDNAPELRRVLRAFVKAAES